MQLTLSESEIKVAVDKLSTVQQPEPHFKTS